MSSGTPKCPKCGKTVYFAERSVNEGQDWHQLCLITDQKEKGGIHNKGYYGTTPQDPEVVFKNKNVSLPVNRVGSKSDEQVCASCLVRLNQGAKFCTACGSRV